MSDPQTPPPSKIPEWRIPIPELLFVPSAFSALLSEYSDVPPDSQRNHIQTVRDRAFACKPYPCLGRFRFLELDLSTHPLYEKHVLPLLTVPTSSLNPPHEPTFLDIGTCLGQDLRKLAFDGVDPSRLYGADLSWDLINAGYELFRDEDRFQRDKQFLVPSNLLDDGKSGTDALAKLDGRCDIVCAVSVFHLFDLPDQRKAADRVVRLLRRDGPGSKGLIMGSQVGSLEAKGQTVGKRVAYRHNMESWRDMWNETLSSSTWKGKVKGCEVGGWLGSANRSEKYEGKDRKENAGGASEQTPNPDDHGFRWQVWWVWVEFE